MKKKIQPIPIQQHLSDLLQLANHELGPALILFWYQLNTNKLPLHQVAELKDFMIRLELKAQEAIQVCEYLEKHAVLAKNQN